MHKAYDAEDFTRPTVPGRNPLSSVLKVRTTVRPEGAFAHFDSSTMRADGQADVRRKAHVGCADPHSSPA